MEPGEGFRQNRQADAKLSWYLFQKVTLWIFLIGGSWDSYPVTLEVVWTYSLTRESRGLSSRQGHSGDGMAGFCLCEDPFFNKNEKYVPSSIF